MEEHRELARLVDDLRGVGRGGGSVPPEVDRAVLSAAREHFAGLALRRRRRRWRQVSGAAAGLAAAALLLVLALRPEGPPAPASGVPRVAEGPDLDGSGRVDILDAFLLARAREQRERWALEYDFDRDGAADRRDVDALAGLAVELERW